MTGQDLLTNSRMNAFQTCRRLHYNLYVLGVRKEPSEALRIGSAVHLGLDLLKQGRDASVAIAPVYRNYQAMIEDTTDPDRAVALAVEYAKASCLIRGWDWRWSNDPLEVVVGGIACDAEWGPRPVQEPRPRSVHRCKSVV